MIYYQVIILYNFHNDLLIITFYSNKLIFDKILKIFSMMKN